MKDRIAHPKTQRPIIQNLHLEFLSHLGNQHDNWITRFPIDLGYFYDMSLIVTNIQTQVFNIFICSLSFQGYLKL